MLNPDLDVKKLKAEYSREGRITIHNILQENFAKELFAAFSKQAWRLQLLDRTQGKRLELTLNQPIDPASPLGVLGLVGQNLDYVKKNIDLNNLFYIRQVIELTEVEAGALKEFREFLDSDEFITVFKDIASVANATYVAAEATCYSKGCFLGEHDDRSDPDNLAAFVFYMTPEWKAEWGGMLMFKDALIAPQWNTFGMFKVPVQHFVSSVSPAATRNRYSVTGWLKGKQ